MLMGKMFSMAVFLRSVQRTAVGLAAARMECVSVTLVATVMHVTAIFPTP
jgi:hypothetical protein